MVRNSHTFFPYELVQFSIPVMIFTAHTHLYHFLHAYISVTGALIYVDPDGGEVTGYDDVFTKLEKARDWYEKCGLGRDYAEQFIR